MVNLVLRLSDVKPSEKIRILENGRPIAAFTEETVAITVSNNSLLEIDGMDIGTAFTVTIIDAPEGIDRTIAKIDKNIEPLTRILLK